KLALHSGCRSREEEYARLAIDSLALHRKTIGRDDSLVLRRFGNDERIRREPATVAQRDEGGRDQILAIGGIEKGEFEWPAASRRHRPKIGRVAPPDLGDSSELQRFDIGADQAAALRAIVHKQREPRAMRQRLDAERAGTGEQIAYARAFQCEAHAEIIVLKDIEDRLAHLVRCRTHARIGWRDEGAAAKLSAGDPHRSFRMKITGGQF